jgi:hypothetical protein
MGIEKKKSGNSEIREKSDGKFRVVFSVFSLHFHTPKKHRKSTITAQNTPFLEKPENVDFGNFGKFPEIFSRNFPVASFSRQFSSQFL